MAGSPAPAPRAPAHQAQAAQTGNGQGNGIGPTKITSTAIHADSLFPTYADHPEERQVVTARLPVTVDVPARLTSTCDCQPGSPQAEQFSHIVVQVKAPGGQVFQGPLSGLDATVIKVAKDVTVRVWLADDGRLQDQAVTTFWTFTLTPTQ
jgi:hypothetical protein